MRRLASNRLVKNGNTKRHIIIRENEISKFVWSKLRANLQELHTRLSRYRSFGPNGADEWLLLVNHREIA
jgi:hypothetical protein